MNYTKLQEIKEYFFEVELHLFKSKKNFIEFLEMLDKEMIEDFNVSESEITELINVLKDASRVQSSEDNKLCYEYRGASYHIKAYGLKLTQSFKAFDKTLSTKFRDTHLSGKVYITQIGGLLLDSPCNIYMLIKE